MKTVNIRTDDFSQYKELAHTFIYSLLVRLNPLLCSIDDTKISDASRFNLDLDKQELNIFVEAINKSIPFLELLASTKQYILGYADSEQIENHSLDKSTDYNGEINILYEHIERYLNGITVVEHYNRKNKLLRKEYYWGLGVSLNNRFGEMRKFSISGLFFSADYRKAICSFKFTK